MVLLGFTMVRNGFVLVYYGQKWFCFYLLWLEMVWFDLLWSEMVLFWFTMVKNGFVLIYYGQKWFCFGLIWSEMVVVVFAFNLLIMVG